MKLGTLNDGTRDGSLVVVSKDGSKYASAAAIAPTMQAALDNWSTAEPRLRALSDELNAGKVADAKPVEQAAFHSPLPRAYEWLDGSAYINHVILVRRARNAEPPATLRTDPLMYQGGSGTFLPPRADIPIVTEDHGCDMEAEIAIVTDDTPQLTTAEEAEDHIKLLMIVNDVSLRSLIPKELAKSFGFLISKPSSAFAPFAVTKDELGDAWKDGRVHLKLKTWLNDKLYGDPEAGPEMFFSFNQLVQHICQTRSLTAGTIIGSGTVSNEDRERGSSCIAEQRMIEKIDTGEFKSPFMKFGDRVAIEMFDKDGNSIFGRIEQRVVKYEKPDKRQRT